MKAVLDSDSELENEDSLTAFTHKSSRSPEPSEVSSTNQLTAKVHPTPPSPGPEYHEIFQPSATPSRLTHRFMVCVHGCVSFIAWSVHVCMYMGYMHM